MAAKLKVDQIESVDGSSNITLNQSITMASGKTLPAASLTGNLPAISGANITAINASNLGSGTVPTARLGSGTANSTVHLRGDGTWTTAGSTNASDLTSGTLPDARFPATLPAASAANLTSVPAANITGTLPAISGANLTGIVSKGKNILLNGAMQISQRSTSTVAQANDSNEGFATLDRWSLEFGNSAGGTITTSKSITQYPTASFSASYKLDVTTADSSISGNEIVFFRQTIEAQHMRSCGWNYLDSNSDITLSFWVYNSKTGIYCIALNTYDGTERMYTAEYTVSSANTWEKKTITIPGYSGLSFDNNSNAGMTLYFMLANASGRYGTANAWGTPPRYGTSNQVNFLDSTSNVGYWTGIQLELGDSATDFEHKQYGEEFALCQRYYQEHDGVKCQLSRLHMSDFDGHVNGFFCSHPTMRANPTLTRGTQYTWYGSDSNWTTTTGKWALQPYNPTHVFTEGSYDGGTGNSVCQIKCDITLDAEIQEKKMYKMRGDFIVRIADDATIPRDEGNIDYLKFLENVKADSSLVVGEDVRDPAYDSLRRSSADGYKPIEEQLDMQYKNDGSWEAHIAAVKTAYPKSNTGGTSIGAIPAWVQQDIDNLLQE